MMHRHVRIYLALCSFPFTTFLRELAQASLAQVGTPSLGSKKACRKTQAPMSASNASNSFINSASFGDALHFFRAMGA